MVQTIVNIGTEWTYDNLEGIDYNSYRMSRSYDHWYYEVFSTYKETETIDLNDKYSRKYKRLVLDDVVITDDYNNKAKKTVDDKINLEQADDPKLIRYTTVEKLRTGEFVERTFLKTKNDSFRLEENDNTKLKKTAIDKILRIADGEGKGVTVSTLEKLKIKDSYNRIMIMREVELPISVVDSDERRGNSVLYDFELFNGEGSRNQISFDEYSKNYHPIGYSDLQPLIPGEYEYKDAYVGIKLSLPPTNGRFGIIDGVLNVDVEDTVVRGSITIENGEVVNYKFDKKYYTVPQIQYRIVYADEDCQVELSEITKDGFKIALKKVGKNEYTNGMIDFLAIGY